MPRSLVSVRAVFPAPGNVLTAVTIVQAALNLNIVSAAIALSLHSYPRAAKICLPSTIPTLFVTTGIILLLEQLKLSADCTRKVLVVAHKPDEKPTRCQQFPSSDVDSPNQT